MKKLFIILSALCLFFSITAVSLAQECERVGQCVNNRTCRLERNNDGDEVWVLSNEANCGSSSIGGVAAPGAIYEINNAVAAVQGNDADGIGIIIFISNLIRLFSIVAGIWAMFNLISAGYIYITSMSDTGATQKVVNNITMTVIGLSIIASAYIIAAIVSALMFGDPMFILQPELQGALQ